MKHLMLALLMLVMGFNSHSQVDSETILLGEGDGLFAFTLAEPQDSFYHVYNSPPDIRGELRYYLFDVAYGYDVVDGVWKLHLAESGCDVVGEVFLTIEPSFVIFDFYVDEVIYPNGNVYRRRMYEKPLRKDLKKF